MIRLSDGHRGGEMRNLSARCEEGTMAVSGDLCVNIDNRLDEIERVASEIEGFLMARGTADTVIFRLNLALEELLVNTITHGLPEDQHHVIHLRLHRDADSIHVTIDDGGIAFNPFDRPDVDTTLSIEDRNIGGLGIQLVREMMSEIGYKRIGDRNHVTLKLLVQDDARSRQKEIKMPDNSSPALMAPTGRLDAGNSRAFEIEVVEVINNSPQGMVMDFAELGYVSSAGLRVILLAAKKLKAGGGKFVLCGLNPSVEEVFKISGFLKILNVTPDRATAMAQFS